MPRASAGCKSVRCGLRNHVQLRHREVSFRRKTLHDRIKSRQLFSRNRSEEHTSELQSQSNLVCRLLLEKKKNLQPSVNPKLQRTFLSTLKGLALGFMEGNIRGACYGAIGPSSDQQALERDRQVMCALTA